MQALTFFFAFVAVLALIGLAAWLVRRFAGNRLGANTNRGRMPRLAVIDAAAVDGRRRLVLVRRDNIEHLLMIGGPTDIVVESNIVRATPATGADAAAARRRQPKPPPRIAPLPDAGLERRRRRQTDAFDHAEPQMPEPPPRPPRPSFADEVRRPAPPPTLERRGDPLAGFTPEPLGGRARNRADSPPQPRQVPPRTEPMMPRPQRQRSAEGAADRAPERPAASRRRRPRRRRRARADAVERRPKPRRDGAAAGSSAAPAVRAGRTARRRAAGRARAAAGRSALARRTVDARRPVRRQDRKAGLRIWKTRWPPCWAVRRLLREIGDTPA